MCSCIFRTMFRMNEIVCMNIRWNMYHPGEMWGKRGFCRNPTKFRLELSTEHLWKNLWIVCITFCINSRNTVGTGQNRAGVPNF